MPKYSGYLRKSTCVIVWFGETYTLYNELNSFLILTQFLIRLRVNFGGVMKSLPVYNPARGSLDN